MQSVIKLATFWMESGNITHLALTQEECSAKQNKQLGRNTAYKGQESNLKLNT